MITGVEIDFVVKDCLLALALYERIFDVERIEVTALPTGQNEAVFSIFGTRFHMLDENPQFHLFAPAVDGPKSIWFNVIVPDIKAVYESVTQAGCAVVQALTEMPEFGISNAIFADPFGYLWMLHQVHREVSFEERLELMEQHTNV